MQLNSDDKAVSVDWLREQSHSNLLSLEECLAKDLLASPDTKKILNINSSNTMLSDGGSNFKLKKNSPVLYPCEILNIMEDYKIPLDYYNDPLVQYFLLNQLKSFGEVNASSISTAYEKHLYRMYQFCEPLSGLTLDIGCDNPDISALIFSDKCQYLGLDPSVYSDDFRIVGIGEVLPFANKSFDNIIFNTSLDHMLDYHTAIDESNRVLKEDGFIVIASYVWTEKATLLKDNIHFHHFREFEILGSLERNHNIVSIERYECPKGDPHRYGIYVKAQKI